MEHTQNGPSKVVGGDTAHRCLMGCCQGEGRGGCRAGSIRRVQVQESICMPEQEYVDGNN